MIPAGGHQVIFNIYMISIKKNRTPLLPQCKFLWDGKLDQKLDKYQIMQFMNCHSTCLFIGKPRSGKTSLLYSLFKSKKLLRQCFEIFFYSNLDIQGQA